MTDTTQALAVPSFRHYFFTRIFSTSGYQAMSVAVAWQVWDITHSAMALGMVGLLQFLPKLVFMPFAGNLADRMERRLIVAAMLVAQALCMLVLTVATATDSVSLTLIYALMIAGGIARTFEMPAMQAFLPSVVPPAILTRAVAMSASAFQLSTIAAPVLAGFVYGLGAAIVHGLATAVFFAGAATVLLVKPLRSQEFASPQISPWQSFIEGLRFVRAQHSILGAISLDMMAVLLGGATALMPIIASEVLHTGAWGLGLLRAAPAAGAVLVSLWLARHPLKQHVGRWLFGGVAVFGVATIAFGLSTSLWLSLLSLAVLGGADMISMVIRGAYIQLATPDALRGRVGAVNGLFIGASNQLGEFESGVTAAWFGAVPAIIIGGIGTIVVAVLWMKLFPELATLNDFPSGNERQ
jgi:MFS family permease